MSKLFWLVPSKPEKSTDLERMELAIHEGHATPDRECDPSEELSVNSFKFVLDCVNLPDAKPTGKLGSHFKFQDFGI